MVSQEAIFHELRFCNIAFTPVKNERLSSTFHFNFTTSQEIAFMSFVISFL
jgi:hypothetical protein